MRWLGVVLVILSSCNMSTATPTPVDAGECPDAVEFCYGVAPGTCAEIRAYAVDGGLVSEGRVWCPPAGQR